MKNEGDYIFYRGFDMYRGYCLGVLHPKAVQVMAIRKQCLSWLCSFVLSGCLFYGFHILNA